MTEEELAAAWHDDHLAELDHDYSSCWCCCIACEHVNPHFDAAEATMTARRAPGAVNP